MLRRHSSSSLRNYWFVYDLGTIAGISIRVRQRAFRWKRSAPVKSFLWRMADGVVSNIILFALIVPSYFIVVWLFPELEYHSRHPRDQMAIVVAIIYTIGLFAAVAVAAVILFIIGAILIGAAMVLFQRDNT